MDGKDERPHVVITIKCDARKAIRQIKGCEAKLAAHTTKPDPHDPRRD